MSTEADPVDSQELIAAYKAILRDVLDKRPSGMRQRLAEALGKNRSFITQIANPAYQTPIPAQHVHPIIQICHFSAQEKDRFLEAYHQAHPRRLLLLKERERSRRLTLMLPDLGSEKKNQKLDTLLERVRGKSRKADRGHLRPVFRNDHAQAKKTERMTIRRGSSRFN